ncbi:MAG: ABC transporter ATP-binding protein [Planctomycetota bacterium]
MTDAMDRDRCAAPPGGIELENVEFRYPGTDYRLRVPRLAIAAGTRSAIVGPSGAGKTTLLHGLAGILPVTTGMLRVDGFELHRASAAERRRFRSERVGLIFQEFELLEHLTVRENILLPFLLQRGHPSAPTAEHRMQALTERSGIQRYLTRKPARLSQGERQRVALCRALIVEPRVVLADEPTGNLDPATTDRVLDSLFDEIALHGATLVMVTHDHSLLPRFDRVIDLPTIQNGVVP